VPRSIRAAPKDHFFQRLRGTGAGLGSDQQIRLVLRYGGPLDLALLDRAIRSVADEEPILRARFVEARPFEGRWELRDGDEERGEGSAFELEEAPRADSAVAAFLADLEVRPGGPYFRVRVVRSSGRDTLCLRVDHRLCDGGGTKLLAARLIDRYRTLAAGLPPPPRREALGPRTLAALTGLKPPPPADAARPQVALTYSLPQRGFANERPVHAVRVIDAATIAAVRQAGKREGASLTDAILVALARALQPFSVAPPGSPVAVMVTTDVRNRLPAGSPELLGNLFQGYVPELRCDPAEPFRSALAAADPESHLLRLQQRTTTFVVLSNVGPLDAAMFDLGTPALLDAQLLGTVALGRELLLCASSFRGALTLSIGFCASDLDPAVVEGVLDRTVGELSELARANGA
jgi:NRPS condensation-like uncharacterized protein